MGKFKGVVYLTEQQYAEMYNNKTLDEDTIYTTDQEPVYSTYEVDAIAKNLQDQITSSAGEEFTKVIVGGEYQPTFDADTKADADALSNYMTKPTVDAGGYMVVPRIDHTGAEGQIRISYNPLQYALVAYNSGGIVKTNTPTDDLHCANKAYVDGIKEELQEQITMATGGEFTKVTVNGVYQTVFEADLKADQSDLESIINNTTVIGDSNKGLRVGEETTANNAGATAIGHFAFADGVNSTALGYSSTADSGNVGGEAYGEYSTAIGEFANANQHSVAIGKGSNAWQDSVAIGNNAVAAKETIGSITEAAKIVQIGEGTNSTPNTVQFFGDNVYNHSTHTLTVQNISLNGSDLGTTVNTNTQNIAGLSSSKADKSELFSGNYNDLTNKPTLFSGNYNDLTNKPTIPDISGYLKVTGENTASYCKLSNGLIFQWGSAVLDQNNNATKNIVLQTPFANSSYGVVASHGTGNISNDYLNSFKITARSKTYFTVKKHFSESSEYIWWIAIGY